MALPMLRRTLPRQAIALLCALLALVAIGVPAQGSALNDILGRPKTTATTTTSTAAASQPAAATTQTTRTQTTTAAGARPKSLSHTSAKTPRGIATPKIATTVPRATTPAGSPSGALPAVKSLPSAKTTVPSGATPPIGTTTSPAGIAPTTTPGLPTGRPGQVRQTAHQSTSLSSAAIVAAALAVLLILLCCIWGFGRWYAYEPHWTLSLRHSLTEAGARMSATWDEFSDWAKLGR
jgi:hypothetical protein